MINRGQTPLEVVGVTVLLVGMLLLVLITTYARNSDTQELLKLSENGIQCNKMNSVIARLYSNRATTKETIHLEEIADINRIVGKPGQVLVGNINCPYIGTVTLTDTPDVLDTKGIRLAKGNWCFVKEPAIIRVTVGECI